MQIGRGSVAIGTADAAAAGVVENGFVVAMEIAPTSGECLQRKGMASGKIWGRSQVIIKACEPGTETTRRFGYLGHKGGGAHEQWMQIAN